MNCFALEHWGQLSGWLHLYRVERCRRKSCSVSPFLGAINCWAAVCCHSFLIKDEDFAFTVPNRLIENSGVEEFWWSILVSIASRRLSNSAFRSSMQVSISSMVLSRVLMSFVRVVRSSIHVVDTRSMNACCDATCWVISSMLSEAAADNVLAIDSALVRYFLSFPRPMIASLNVYFNTLSIRIYSDVEHRLISSIKSCAMSSMFITDSLVASVICISPLAVASEMASVNAAFIISPSSYARIRLLSFALFGNSVLDIVKILFQLLWTNSEL